MTLPVDEIVPLWEHQKKAIDLALGNVDRKNPYFMFLMEQGTGKTPTTITLLRCLFARHRKPLKTLIFCPSIVVENWAREIEKFSHCGRYVQPLMGSKAHRIKALATPGKSIFITNYESLDMEGLFWEEIGSGKKSSRKPLDLGFEVVIFDEIHRLKNPTGKRTKVALKMSKNIYYRYGLTGTLILKNAQDVWAPFSLIDGGTSFSDSFYVFRDKYFIDKNASMPSKTHFPDYKMRIGADGYINELIYRHAFRVTKEECLDLPELVMQSINVEMSKDQQKHYNEMRDEFITYIKGDACVAQVAVSKALRLMQIVSGFMKMENGDIAAFGKTPRITALEELLQDYRDQKIIVWAAFQDNYLTIARACERQGLSYTFLTGQQNQAEKEKAVADFTKGDTNVLIANPGAGGTGVNLVESSVAIWFSRSFNLEHRLQALARNHRGGSEIHEKVTSIDLVTPGTIDELCLLSLQNKENIAEHILKMRDKL